MILAGIPWARAQEEVFPPPPQQEDQAPEEPAGPAASSRGVPAGKRGKSSQASKTEAQSESAPSEIKPEPPMSSPSKRPARLKKPGRVSPELAKITIRLSDVPLTVFLKAISQQTRVNFIVSEGLEVKKITAFLEEVTLEEAFNVLLGIKGLAYEKIPGKTHTYLITTRKETQPRTITRIFELNYIPLQDIKVDNLKGENESASNQISGVDGASEQPSDAFAQQQTGSPGYGILSILKTILSSFGKIAVDERTNSLIVTDLPERFSQIEGLIRDLDKKSPQVSIEAQIVEINSNGLQRLGVEFGGDNGELMRFVGPSRFTELGLAPGSDGRLFPPTPLNDAIIGGGATAVKGPVAVSAYDTRYGTTLGVLSFSEFQVLLRAIVTKTRGKILARPRITTINNKPAEIRVTTNQAIGTSAAASGLTGGTIGTSVERQQTGIILRVTPQVNGDGFITMVVEPKLIRVADSLIGLGVKDPVTRAVKTMIRVRNGDTVVLGGLMDTSEDRTVRKVPFLGDIPIIGWIFFRSYRTEKRNSELAIFLTPTILDI